MSPYSDLPWDWLDQLDYVRKYLYLHVAEALAWRLEIEEPVGG